MVMDDEWRLISQSVEEQRRTWQTLCPEWDSAVLPIEPSQEVLAWILQRAIYVDDGVPLSRWEDIGRAAHQAASEGLIPSYSGFISWVVRTYTQSYN